MWTRLNLNEGVRVQLTQRGRDLYSDYRWKETEGIPQRLRNECLQNLPHPDDEGFLVLQFHEFLGIFGSEIRNNEQPVLTELNVGIPDRVGLPRFKLASGCGECKCCHEPWCDDCEAHYADCACKGPNDAADEGLVVVTIQGVKYAVKPEVP